MASRANFVPELSIFLVKGDQHSGGSDAPSIVFLVIRHLETEFVRNCGRL